MTMIDEQEEAVEHQESDAIGDQKQEMNDSSRAEEEDKARAKGWAPREEWTGSPDGWVDADEYLRRGDPQYLRRQVDDTNRALKRLIRERQTERQSFNERLERLDRMNSMALKRQREQLLVEAERVKRQAALEGDIESYDQIAREQRQIEEHYAKEEADLMPRQAPQSDSQRSADGSENINPDINRWIQSNPAIWFNPEKRSAAIAFYSEAENELVGAGEIEKLRFVTERLAEAYGDNAARMPGQRRQPQTHAPQPEGGSRMARSSEPRGKTWNGIPAEERTILARHIKEGLYDEPDEKHDPVKAQARAAKAYWS